MVDNKFKQDLLRKGWLEEEANKTVNMLYDEEKQIKHVGYKQQTNFIVYWTTLLVLTIANFLISIILIPFLLVLKPFQLEVIMVFLGLIFGAMFNLIVRDIEHIEEKHHLAAAVFIPSIALITVFVIVSISNSLSQNLQSYVDYTMQQNPVFTSIVYVIAFVIPYSYTSFRDFLRNRKR